MRRRLGAAAPRVGAEEGAVLFRVVGATTSSGSWSELIMVEALRRVCTGIVSLDSSSELTKSDSSTSLSRYVGCGVGLWEATVATARFCDEVLVLLAGRFGSGKRFGRSEVPGGWRPTWFGGLGTRFACWVPEEACVNWGYEDGEEKFPSISAERKSSLPDSWPGVCGAPLGKSAVELEYS